MKHILANSLANLLLTAGAVVFFSGCASLGSSPSAKPAPTETRVVVAKTDPTKQIDPKVAEVKPPDSKQADTKASEPQGKASSAELNNSTNSATPEVEMPPLPPADLWERMRGGFSMAELNSPLVAEKEKFYLSKPEYLQRMFSRGSRYLFFIMEEIDKRGMPMELALLPFVESAMNPNAMSSAKAAGLWQFIPSTGKQYNLSQNWWVDNRRDVSKATIAALEYLQRIYKLQGDDWFLALASYNWGEGSVGRAMKANASRGLPTDYLSLSMPAETRNYVPKLIALKNIVMRAKELGLLLPDAPNEPYFVSIEKTRPIDLKLAAQFAGMSVDEFVSLNPAHNRPVIAASKNAQLLIPTARVQGFLSAIERHSDAKGVFASWQPRTLVAGDTLESLALAGKVSVADLRRANGIQNHQRILPGTRILAPHASVKDETLVETFVAPRVVEAISQPEHRVTVGKKDTLQSIAKRHGVSVAALKSWNGIKKGVRKGASLVVRPALTQTVVTSEAGTRQVVSQAQARVIPVANKFQAADDETEKPACKSTKKKRCKPEAAGAKKKGGSKKASTGKSKAGKSKKAKRV